MLVQMIELEEVIMVETSDDVLEAAVAEVGGAYSGPNTVCPGLC